MQVGEHGLVERDGELSLLKTLLAECFGGKGRVAAVSGPVASGKTELLHLFGEYAASQGAVVLRAAGSHAERGVPLGVMGQLFRSAAAVSSRAEGVAWLLAEGSLTAALSDWQLEATGQSAAQTLHSLCLVLLDLARSQPVVICIDAEQYADIPSLQCLLILVRHMMSARILVVLTENASPHALFRAELLAQPHCRHIRLAPLSVAAVTRLLAAPGSAADVDRLAHAYHAASGGNLLLVRALIEDGVRADEGPPLAVGDAFAHAVLDSLRRGDPAMRAAARALAVLDGERVTDALLGQMIDVAPQTATAAVDSLTTAGLVESGRFRHPAARDTVLREVPAGERARLHRRAAVLLHAAGASPVLVARHLVDAEHVDEPWAVAVLVDAAWQAEPATAFACLELASRADLPEAERAEVMAMLAYAEWRIDPATAGRHMPDLIKAVDAGHLRSSTAIFAIKHMLWYGWIAEAEVALAKISAATDGQDAELAVELSAARSWIGYGHPPLLAQLADRPEARPDGALTSVTFGPPLQAATALVTAIRQPTTEDTIGVAEQVLQRARLDGTLIEPVLLALTALIYLDRPDKATAWCEVLHGRPTVAGSPTWHALVYAIQAEAALRQGDLPAAERHARAALDRIPAAGWGVAIGLPLATLLMATTGMGRYDEAAACLKLAVPDATFDTCFGLHYRYARGRYELAVGRPEAALRDFQTCGDLMARWGMDPPAMVPWRTDAAQALVQLGQKRAARDLVERQLAALRSGYSRARGAALRVLARTGTLRQRGRLLRDAVDVLQSCGDRFELAHALADLSEAYYALGESNRARLMVRRAHHLARVCRAEPLCQALLPNLADAGVIAAPPPATGEAPEAGSPDTGLTSLSEAERRVAVLAAQGHSNREIARKLYITNSTVEQHLTRIYRKLNVNRRSDLPVRLHL